MLAWVWRVSHARACRERLACTRLSGKFFRKLRWGRERPKVAQKLRCRGASCEMLQRSSSQLLRTRHRVSASLRSSRVCSEINRWHPSLIIFRQRSCCATISARLAECGRMRRADACGFGRGVVCAEPDRLCASVARSGTFAKLLRNLRCCCAKERKESCAKTKRKSGTP